jgi:TPR repeat protein
MGKKIATILMLVLLAPTIVAAQLKVSENASGGIPTTSSSPKSFWQKVEDFYLRWANTDSPAWQHCVAGVPILYFSMKPDSYLTMSRLGWFYESGACFFRNPKRAEALYRPGAERGEEVPAMLLGNLYLRGIGVPKDYSKAKKWFDIAALHTVFGFGWDLKGIRNLVFFIRDAPKELFDSIEKMKLLEKSNASTLYQLGESLVQGDRGMPRNLKLARHVFDNAVWAKGRTEEMQYSFARRLLDGFFPLGNGETKRDRVKRGLLVLFHASMSVPGYRNAQQELAQYFDKGEWIDRDPFFAFVFYRLAQKSGLDVDQDVDRLRAELKPEKIKEAEDDIGSYLFQVKSYYHRKFYRN